MKIAPIALFVLIIGSTFFTAKADVPPEPGFKRVSLSLILEPQDDFAEYRFFMISGGDVKEVFLKAGASTTIAPLGGGSFYRSGVLLAFPRPMLSSYSDVNDGKKLSDLQQKIYDRDLTGTELITHTFVMDLPQTEAAGLKDPVYRLERDSAVGIKVVQMSGGHMANMKQSVYESGLYSTGPKTPAFWITVAGGVLITFVFITFGVRLARRQKSRGLVTGSSK